ncbi:MAG: metal-dependent hydrolase [Verrucomicrobiales bacterium]|nr:metal-dependent hydrolase [Verrucomicrobiales bacterium]
MDSITQAALGAVVGDLLLRRQLGRRALLWGAVLGTLPDLDALLFLGADHASQLRSHRGLSHAVLLWFVSSALLAPLFHLLWRRRGVSLGRAASFVFLAWSTHVLIDVFTAYGTQIWEPFSHARVSTSNLFIIDPLFTLPLLIGIGFSLWRNPPAAALRAQRVGLAVAGIYVAWSLAARGWMDQQMRPHLQALENVRRHTLAPTPLNTLLWRVLVETDDAFLITHRSLFDPKSSPQTWIRLPKEMPTDLTTEQTAVLSTPRWFSQDWLLLRRQTNGLYAADLRLSEILSAESPTCLTPVFGWVVDAHQADPLIPLHPRLDGSIGPQLRNLFRRAMGDRDALPIPQFLSLPSGYREPISSLETFLNDT